MAKLKYSVRAIVNVGNYESITHEYGEEIELSEQTPSQTVARHRDALISRITAIVEREVLKTRRDLETPAPSRRRER